MSENFKPGHKPPHVLAEDETAERPLPTSPLESAFFFLALSPAQRDRFIDELPRYRIAKQRGTSMHLFPVEAAGFEGADINDRLSKIGVSLSTLSDVDEEKYLTAAGLMKETMDCIDPVWSAYNDTKNQLREAREKSTQRDASTIERLERQLAEVSAQMADVNPFQLVDPTFHGLVLDLEYYLRTLLPEDRKDEIIAYLHNR